jgi:type IV secretory pathway VirB2 component (pilin)
LVLALALPELADAALRNAAGGGGGGGGFAALTRYLDRLASYLIPVGGAAAVLGLIAGGFMFMAGNPGAQKVLGYVALGVVIVLASKGLAA